MLRAAFALGALLVTALGPPAIAGEDWHRGHGAYWRATHDTIYELENMIAYLEEDPEIDDGYKAPIIQQARADILRLRATLRPAHWRWAVPCCYSRRPIYIR